jgi:hypothetical protein
MAPTPIEFVTLVLHDAFEIPFLSSDSEINFVLHSIAPGTAVTCETKADNGDLDLYAKEGERPITDFHESDDVPNQEGSYGEDSNETVTLTTLETSNVFVVVHAYLVATHNATIACCIGEGPCS